MSGDGTGIEKGGEGWAETRVAAGGDTIGDVGGETLGGVGTETSADGRDTVMSGNGSGTETSGEGRRWVVVVTGECGAWRWGAEVAGKIDGQSRRATAAGKGGRRKAVEACEGRTWRR